MFDPYHTWLGIPPKDQPADHYRVLGLARFEDNADVIGNAADRQMAHVRNAGGNHEHDQAAVLSRLSTARVCLLDPAKRQQYDRMLLETSRIEQAKKFNRPPMPGPTKLDRGVAVADPRPPRPGATRLDPRAVPVVQPVAEHHFVAEFIPIFICLSLAGYIVWAVAQATIDVIPRTDPRGAVNKEPQLPRTDDPQPQSPVPLPLPGNADYDQAMEIVLKDFEREAQKVRKDFNAEIRRHNLGGEWEISEQQINKVIDDVKAEVARQRRRK